MLLVVQCLLLSAAVGVGAAAACYRSRALTSLANNVSAVGLTIPSLALIGLLIAPLGSGVVPAVVVITFYVVLPILRNAVVGLSRLGGANSLESVVTGTVAVVVLAVILDGLLVLAGRLTTSRGTYA